MATKATLTVDLADPAADNRLKILNLQGRIDAAIAGALDTVRVSDNGSDATVAFDDVIADEQIIACYQAAVNLAGLPESGFVSGTPALSGSVSSGARQRLYSV
jgi:hypothetical protein